MDNIEPILHNSLLEQFNWVDYSVIFIIGISALISIIRGFLREAISLASWILAFWISLEFSHLVADLLITIIPHNTLRNIAAIVILLVLVLLIGMLVAYCVDKLIKKGKLSTLDRLLGLIFGVSRGIIVCALLVFFGTVMSLENMPWWTASKTIPLLKQPVKIIDSNLPKQIENISVLMLLNNKHKSASKADVAEYN